jgi:hypothetical protein
MRRILMKTAAVAAAVVAAIGLAATPANAVGPVNVPFGMAYGASTTSGTIHFTVGHSASVNGAVHAVSTPKWICVVGFNGGLSDGDPSDCSATAYPGGPNVGFSFGLRIVAPGGVQRVLVYMYEDSDGYRIAAALRCTRNGCTRIL